MLIIPFEKTVDWKHPPWMTFCLMLVCLLVFTFYQGKDSRLMNSAVEAYLNAGLDRLEAPAYEDYLQRRIRLEDENLHDQLAAFRQAVEQDYRLGIAVALLSDRAFYGYLQDNRDLIWTAAERQQWQTTRVAIQHNQIERISANELGLVPAEMSLYSLITYQFLHGGWGHLIGNMVFLFLLGFTVERALGPVRYLLAYLACGALSGVIYTLFTLGSTVPLVGASGSISGLMGMYVAFFGARRIRFFYFLVVYFNFFRAPALTLLPVWFAKELFDYWTSTNSGVAYLAHAGGLAAGAALVFLLRRNWMQVSETFYEPEQEEQDQQFAREYGKAMAALGRMDFQQAQQQFAGLWREHPQRPVLLEHLYQLAKLRPDQPEYRERALELLHLRLKLQQPDKAVAVWQEYMEQAEDQQPLAPVEHNRVLFAALREDDLKTAEKAFERIRRSGQQDLIHEAGRLLVDEFNKRQMGPKANEYRALLKTL
ncbi:rhomboid family intramembrane serine protease [uncultured Marinobacter sp.]|uniref:rhomboid family intramembrane serine protease n=1 Tax=uncultured Marinobacter sp. TaxID=187379 RepID=UPI0030DA18A1